MATKVGILGAGTWGTALAVVLAKSGNDVCLWARRDTIARGINTLHKNPEYLFDTFLPPNITATTDIEQLATCDALFVAVPAVANAPVAALISKVLPAGRTVVVSAKGFRESDGALLTDVWREMIPGVRLAVLTGPAFSSEVVAGKAAAVVLAAEAQTTIDMVERLFTMSSFRLYFSTDMVGAQVGGAMKNSLALAAGMVDGLELGQSARAAVLTRGLAEMARYGQSLGARFETMMGLAGLGDVLLSATSTTSRNYRCGQRMGQGVPARDAIRTDRTVEGVMATRVVAYQAAGKGLELSLISAMDGILQGDVQPRRAVELLLDRPRQHEF